VPRWSLSRLRIVYSLFDSGKFLRSPSEPVADPICPHMVLTDQQMEPLLGRFSNCVHFEVLRVAYSTPIFPLAFFFE
jgi:hypothetical protein